MTEKQAHDFVQRWQKFVFPVRWRAKTYIRAVKQLEQTFLSIAGGTIAVMATSMDDPVVESVAAAVLFSLTLLYLRAHQAQRVLRYARVINRKP